jgi:hypothetical protein
MQLLPETGAAMKVGDIHQEEPNIHAGIKYFYTMMQERYGDEPMDALNKILFTFASYNCGPNRVKQLNLSAHPAPEVRRGGTHRSHERFSRRKWGQLWPCRRSVDCIIATNDGLPEKPDSTTLRAFSPWAIGICVRAVLPCRCVHRRISFTRLRQGRKLLEAFGPVGTMTSLMGCTGFSVGSASRKGRHVQ